MVAGDDDVDGLNMSLLNRLMHSLLLCHRSNGNGNERLWKVGTIWIFRSCRGVRYRRTSCRSVGGRRFSAGALNSDGSELG